MERRIDATPRQKWDAIAASGNMNHWGNWIHALEERLRTQPPRYLSEAEDYVSWLLMSPEYTVYLLRWILFVKSNFIDQDVFDASYSNLLTRIPADAPAIVQEHLRFAVTVRHILIHKGFPNQHEVPSNRESTAGKADFIAQVREVILKPESFLMLKERFTVVAKWLSGQCSGVSFGF